jgi:hypothetical protein
MDSSSSLPESYLFLVRVWRTDQQGGASEWRGKLQAVPGSTTHMFDDWPALIALLRSMLADVDDDAGTDSDADPAAGTC